MLFNLKVQCLPDIPKEGLPKTLEEEVSIACQIIPNEELMINKKGHFYIVLNIKSKEPADLKTTITLFCESLKDSFYKSDDEPTLQSLEKALKKSVNIMTNTDYSFCAVVIRERVLYLSYLGDPAVYLIRGTNQPKDLIGKGNTREIWTTTSLLFGDEIVLIGTEEISKKYNSETILNALPTLSSITHHKHTNHNNSLAAILIKITPLDSRIKKSIMDNFKYDLIRHKLTKVIDKTNVINNSNKSLYEQFKQYNVKRPTSAVSISGWQPGWAADLNLKGARQYRKLTTLAKNSSKSYLIKIAVLVIVGATSLIGIKYYIDSNRQNNINRDLVSNISNRQINPTIENAKDDKDAKKQEIPFEFDLNTIDNSFNLLGLAYLKDNNLIVLDKTTKALYQIDLTKKTSKKILDKLTNPEYLTCQDNLCYVYDTENIYLINPDRAPLFNKFFIGISNLIDLKAYAGTLYVLTTSGINSLTMTSINQTKLEDYIKEENPDVKSFANDGNNYVLSNKEVVKYNGTKKDPNFTLSSQIELKNPSQIAVLENRLYILEPESKSIVVVDKLTGALTEQKFIETEAGKTISFFTIGDRKNKFIYYTVDNKIYLYR